MNSTKGKFNMLLDLCDPTLFRQQGFIGGQWRDGTARRMIEVIDPATDRTVGTVPDMDGDDTRAAVEAAAAAFSAWRRRTHAERAALLEGWYGMMIANLEDLARILTIEQGKPLEEARGEIRYGAAFVKWFAEEARRVGGSTIPSPTADRRIVTMKEPVRVCGI
ncbi:aldehyde dehydrogenase family protein [Azospirillum sp. A26]|uniref:aldehyde dehydrogenase family protein n=1 Tax=Azospirillum sp. A26 TaxID=3160607 RepID=UPI00366B2546